VTTPATAPPGKRREIYIDAFRGLMALVMVQGHLCDSLLRPDIRAEAFYQFQTLFHGSTAPGFLFASGFVAGLPRAPLSLRASLRRARRLLFVLLVGYALHLPYFSFWKTALASPAEKAALFACHALQVIAVTQLFVLGLQWIAGRRWIAVAGVLTVVVLAAGPWVWAAGLGARLPTALAPYVDQRTGSTFPVFPYSAFVLAGTVAGAALGRRDATTRHRRALLWGFGLLVLGAFLARLLEGKVDFWSISPGYALIRLGGLLLLLRLVEAAAAWRLPGTQAFALLGHETLLVYCLHLYFLFGGVVGAPPLGGLVGRLGFTQAALVLALMVPVLLGAAWVWNRLKARAPREASLLLAFLTVYFTFLFLLRPW
jgi:fucose 4-O-acetylase-like acetyltransferase